MGRSPRDELGLTPKQRLVYDNWTGDIAESAQRAGAAYRTVVNWFSKDQNFIDRIAEKKFEKRESDTADVAECKRLLTQIARDETFYEYLYKMLKDEPAWAESPSHFVKLMDTARQVCGVDTKDRIQAIDKLLKADGAYIQKVEVEAGETLADLMRELASMPEPGLDDE